MELVILFVLGLVAGAAAGGLAARQIFIERLNAAQAEIQLRSDEAQRDHAFLVDSHREEIDKLRQTEAAIRKAQIEAVERDLRTRVDEAQKRFVSALESKERESSVKLRAKEEELAYLKSSEAKLRRDALESAERERVGLIRQLQDFREDEERLKNAFKALAQDSLDANRSKFASDAQEKLAPLVKIQGELRQQVAELEAKREGAYAALTTQAEALQRETHSLNQLLSSPKLRGDWGEFHLTRVVELAGLKEYCDFQVQVQGEDGRPDLVVRLPGRREVVVDSKVVLEAFQRYLAAESDVERELALDEHVAAIRARIDNLSSKDYSSQFESLDFVVMYIPLDAAYYAALQADRELFDYQAKKRVFIAGPVTLLSILRSIAYSWRQHAMVQNATKIGELAEEFHKRLKTFAEHLDGMGSTLTSLVKAHGKAVGSFGRMLLPQARKLESYVAVEAARLIVDPEAVEEEIRILGTEEFESAPSSSVADPTMPPLGEAEAELEQ